MREKGIKELLEAIDRLNNEGYHCVLTILGSFEEDLREAVENNNNVRFEGWQKDILPFVASSHCFVLPSYHEGMANTNLECAACGRPVITSNVPGCKEAVIDGVTGFLCEPENTDSIYEAMKKMICLDKREQERMGIQGRKYMQDVFDKTYVVDKTIEFLSL